jgi:hypothetical protein
MSPPNAALPRNTPRWRNSTKPTPRAAWWWPAFRPTISPARNQQLTQAQPHAAKPDGSDFKARLEGYGIKIDNDTDVMWNFEKFLLDGQGQVVARFSPDTPPDHPMVTDAIERLLS